MLYEYAMNKIYVAIPMCLLFLMSHCSNEQTNQDYTIPLERYPNTIAYSPVPITGPVHPQSAQIEEAQDDHSLAIRFESIGSKVTFFMYDIDPLLPSLLRYDLRITKGRVKVSCEDFAKEHARGQFQEWFLLNNKNRIQILQIMALQKETQIILRSMQAIRLEFLNHPPMLPEKDVLPPFENAGFEKGDLTQWEAEGEAFENQPTYQDNAAFRWGYVGSFPVGDYWIGTFEDRPGPLFPPKNIQMDDPQGTLTSEPFLIDKRFLTGLVGGGQSEKTAVSILIADQETARFTGTDHEEMYPFVLDMSEYRGLMCRIQIIDEYSGPWGHVNVDNFFLFGDFP